MFLLCQNNHSITAICVLIIVISHNRLWSKGGGWPTASLFWICHCTVMSRCCTSLSSAHGFRWIRRRLTLTDCYSLVDLAYNWIQFLLIKFTAKVISLLKARALIFYNAWSVEHEGQTQQSVCRNLTKCINLFSEFFHWGTLPKKCNIPKEISPISSTEYKDMNFLK